VANYKLRGGKIMAFENPYAASEVFPASFWVLDDSGVSGSEGLLRLTFRGWRSTVDYDADRMFIAEKVYTFGGAEFVAITQRSSGLPAETPEIARDLVLAWSLAFETRDQPAGVDAGNNQLFRSFFEGAVDAV
jgi:hypothetical protein